MRKYPVLGRLGLRASVLLACCEHSFYIFISCFCPSLSSCTFPSRLALPSQWKTMAHSAQVFRSELLSSEETHSSLS